MYQPGVNNPGLCRDLIETSGDWEGGLSSSGLAPIGVILKPAVLFTIVNKPIHRLPPSLPGILSTIVDKPIH